MNFLKRELYFKQNDFNYHHHKKHKNFPLSNFFIRLKGME